MAEIRRSRDPRAQKILDGFKINYMNLRNAENGNILWESTDWVDKPVFMEEMVAHVPADVLKCSLVSRELNFSSLEQIENFKLIQRVFLMDQPLEEWHFDFGFVIPDSTNSWQIMIEAASETLPAEILNGNVTIETSFFDGRMFVSKSVVRIFYDG